MANILVADQFGAVCVSSEDGITLNASIRRHLDAGEDVRLDFAGVKTLASAFLNAAVGELYSTYAPPDLETRLTWTGLSAANDSVMRLVRRNAVRFYRASRPEREALVLASGECGAE